MPAVNHNPKIQVLRALAIVAVVFIHTCPSGMWQVFFRPFVNFGVGLFLFLSGMLTGPRKLWMPFFRKRILRVLVPYVIWTVLYALQKGAPEKIFFNLITAKANAAFYYVFVYIQFVLLTPWLLRLAKSRMQWLGWLVAPFSVLLFRYLPAALGMTVPAIAEDLWNICCAGWFTFYYLGLVLGNSLLRRPLPGMAFTAAFLVLSVVLQILEGYLWFRCGLPNCGSQLKLTSMLTTATVLLLAYTWLEDKTKTGRYRLPVCIGNVSFGIYLSHIMVIRVLSCTSFYALLPFGLNTLLVFAATFVPVALLSRLTGPRLSALLGLR